MNLLEKVRTVFSGRPPVTTAAEIRSELHSLRGQHALTVQQRDLLAYDAVGDGVAALRWAHLDDTVTALAHRMQVLTTALPAAEARERQAAERAELVRRERALAAYRQHAFEADRFTSAAIASLPNGELLTRLRDLRDALAAEARELRTWSADQAVRRPLDPLGTVIAAMQSRMDRVERARHAPHAAITLEGGASTETLAQATARVNALNLGVEK